MTSVFMKKKQRDEIKAKSIGELEKLVKESEELIFRSRLEKAQNKLKNLRQIFNERKRIALATTLINEKLKIEKALGEKKTKERKGLAR